MLSRVSKRATTVAVAAVCAGAMVSAEAIPVTSQAALGGPLTVIDFSQFDIGDYTFGVGPTQVGGLVGEDVTFTATSAFGGFGGGGYGLGGNGNWSDASGPGGRDGYAFTNVGDGSITFSFNSGPVSAVGGFINYAPGSGSEPVTLEALGLGGIVLELFNLTNDAPISTPGATDDGAFRGIVRATADIVAFRLSNQFVLIDDLSFVSGPRTAVPEPATTALLGLGLLGAGIARRRARG